MCHRPRNLIQQPASPPAPPSHEDPPALSLRLVWILALVAVVVLSVAAGCGGDDDASSTPTPGSSRATPDSLDGAPTQLELPISVAVSLPLFEDFVREVGLENVEVFSLVPAGADPHTYRLTEADIARLAGVDFFFVNGAGLDTAIAEAIEENRDEEAYVIPFAPNIRSPQGNGLYAEEAGDNAHLWLDPDLADVYPETIADTFVIYDGINESFYNGNWQIMQDEFMDFLAEALGRIAAIPEANRKLFTYHDSVPHLARALGLSVAGFAIPNPGVELSAEQLSTSAVAVAESGVPAIFAEHGYDATAIEQIAGEAGVQVCTLYTDIMPEGVSTYLETMRANVDELVRCLAGS